MAKSLIKLLAVPALLAGVARGLTFLNDIPVDTYYEVGSDFVLEWEPEARADTFKLTMNTFLVDPIVVKPGTGITPPTLDFKDEDIVLDEAVKFSDGNYTWTIEKIDDRTGAEYWYRFGASYDTTAVYPRSFHIKATS